MELPSQKVSDLPSSLPPSAHSIQLTGIMLTRAHADHETILLTQQRSMKMLNLKTLPPYLQLSPTGKHGNQGTGKCLGYDTGATVLDGDTTTMLVIVEILKIASAAFEVAG